MTSLRVAIYCRISQDREGREAGVDRQQEDCRALAERLGAKVVDVYIDNDISASTRSNKVRPRYRQLLADARAGRFDVVLAYTTGRLTRRPREHEDLIELAEKHGISFEYVRSPTFDLNTAAGRRVARILAATDAGEAEDIQERVQRQKLQTARDGEWKGGRRPFGYEADGMTVCQAEADEVYSAALGILAGRSVNSLIKDMNNRGIVTPAGCEWNAQNFRRVLLRPRNSGLMEHQGQVIGPAKWAPIVPDHIRRGVIAVLTDPSRRTSPGNARRWRGSGLYKCHCEATVRVHLSGGGRGKSSCHAYHCAASKHLSRIASEVDRYIDDVVIERLSRPDAVELLGEDNSAEVAAAMASIGVLRSRLNELALQFARGDVDGSQLASGSALIRGQLEEAEAKVTDSMTTSVLGGIVGEEDVEAAWRGVGLDRQRAAINVLFTVELWQSPRGRPKGWEPGQSYFDPATVKVHWKVPR